MFCPTCGRVNSIERKFCVSCGTNLQAVTQALSGSEDDFFTKIDTALNQFIARYSEHVFKNAPSAALDQRVGRSWQILGQGMITSFVDMILFTLMWNIFPLRFLMLLISTPVRLLSDRNKDPGSLGSGSKSAAELSDPSHRAWLPNSVDSVTEHTTMMLGDSDSPNRRLDLKISSPK